MFKKNRILQVYTIDEGQRQEWHLHSCPFGFSFSSLPWRASPISEGHKPFLANLTLRTILSPSFPKCLRCISIYARAQVLCCLPLGRVVYQHY